MTVLVSILLLVSSLQLEFAQKTLSPITDSSYLFHNKLSLSSFTTLPSPFPFSLSWFSLLTEVYMLGNPLHARINALAELEVTLHQLIWYAKEEISENNN